ncbi:hypothetical protein JCM10212_005318 [Sporobolomyces blumeae]
MLKTASLLSTLVALARASPVAPTQIATVADLTQLTVLPANQLKGPALPAADGLTQLAEWGSLAYQTDGNPCKGICAEWIGYIQACDNADEWNGLETFCYCTADPMSVVQECSNCLGRVYSDKDRDVVSNTTAWIDFCETVDYNLVKYPDLASSVLGSASWTAPATLSSSTQSSTDLIDTPLSSNIGVFESVTDLMTTATTVPSSLATLSRTTTTTTNPSTSTAEGQDPLGIGQASFSTGFLTDTAFLSAAANPTSGTNGTNASLDGGEAGTSGATSESVTATGNTFSVALLAIGLVSWVVGF